MPDMLVKLYTLPTLVADPPAAGISVRRAALSERRTLFEWVERNFGTVWALGSEIAFEQRPVPCFVAAERVSPSSPDELLVGFALYDVASKGMFGPIGVREDYQGRGIGTALLLSCLHAMADEGYSYAIIGAVGPAEFYAKTVGATLINDSDQRAAHPKLRG